VGKVVRGKVKDRVEKLCRNSGYDETLTNGDSNREIIFRDRVGGKGGAKKKTTEEEGKR